MSDVHPPSKASIAGHPIHALLVPFPIVCFIGALLTDITYAKTGDMQWTNFSAWLLAVGAIMGGLAAIAGLIDFVSSRAIRSAAPAWPHAIGNVVVIVLAIFNNFVHSRDAYTSVVPTGLILSVLTVLIMLVTGWLGGSLVYRHRVGVRP